MRAHPGDWLVVERADDHREARRGHIEEVAHPDGTPPYLVRWTDTERRALVFPGPDAHILTSAELHERDEAAQRRAARLQHAIRTRG
ncbi:MULTISPECIES: DUF1918 domain-containing protein [Actinokineospora]|uniref:DUF1918 domain-containing protein n=1 Tax=Actinokineospora fastidiosa TaxID=1816 RepID=A0A918GBZ3_9PSEU|nr:MULTISPECIES: DUF1918 domain-containing protein [Actinokineospora]UVS79450.1 hypothetical protein Actkin_03198 [Actinokineospora sp. UTMC 2448]GGS28353.1 hypothetical protein GCM10010171_21730 [Actinokineospora fastidiosa]